MLRLIALFSLAAIAEAKVAFKSSTIYDEVDLNSNADIDLESCKNGGCSVYISVPQWNAEATRNLFVYSPSGTNVSLYSYATEVDVMTWAKTGLHLSNTEYKLQNLNTKPVDSIVIYVVGSQAEKHDGGEKVEIYDAANVGMRPSTNKKLTMIMSAEPFNLYVEAYGINPLNAFVRATGFDNNFERNASPDNCRIIYDHNEAKPFRLRINSPIITINFDGQNNYKICANIDDHNAADIYYSGIVTSQGYIGCDANAYAVYRSKLYKSPDFELKDPNNNDRQTEFTYAVNTKSTDTVSITNFFLGGSDNFQVPGDGTQSTRTEKGYKVTVSMNNVYGSSYWMKYAPGKNDFSTIPSAEGICPDPSKTTTGSATKPTETTTTSGASELFTVLTSAIVFLVARQF